MSAANVDLIKSIYRAFSAGDVPLAIAAMDEAIEWNEAENFPYSDGNPYRGPDAVLGGVFARLAADWDGFGVEPAAFHDAGDTVIMTGRYVGTHKGTGRPMNPQVVHVWTVADGKAARFQQFVDTLAVARTIGVA
jgi:ketosteroid isomerase-like protein